MSEIFLIFSAALILHLGFAVGTQVTLFEHSNYFGASLKMSVNNDCQNLPGEWNDQASSVKTDSCVILFEHGGCQGRWLKLPSASVINNLVDWNFNDIISSVRSCAGENNNNGNNGNSNGLCLNEHNAVRRQNGKNAFRYNTLLERAAQRHSERVYKQNCWPTGPHQCPGEPNFSQRAKNEGYPMGSGAENMYQGLKDCGSAVVGWMHSERHRTNLMGNYAEIGCALYEDIFTCLFGNQL